MAEFEGNLSLNVETSEIEIKGKFKLSEEELDNVAGGSETTPEEIPDFYRQIVFQCTNGVCGSQYVWFDTYKPTEENIPCCDKCGAKMRIRKTNK